MYRKIYSHANSIRVLMMMMMTQEECHTGFLIHLLLSTVRAFIFLARRIQPFLSLVDREVEFCVLLNNDLIIVLHPLGILILFFKIF